MWSNVSSNSSLLRQMQPKNRSTFLIVLFLGFVIFGFLLSFVAFGQKPPSTLKSVHVVFRHGARTPSSSYPNDPHGNKYWPEGWGGLTRTGKKQLYDLGQTLKKLYGSFIGDRYVPEELYTLSSYAPRCQMSALTLLAALFPPHNDQIWHDDIPWQPIPINSVPRNVDRIIAAKVNCFAFSLEKSKSDLEVHTDTYDSNKKLFEYLTLKAGKEMNSVAEVENLFYIFTTQQENGLKLPDWAHSVYPDQMEVLAKMYLAMNTRTEILKKFQAGPMLEDWLKHFNETKSKTKLFLYSAHDLTLVNVMRTLGVKDEFMPRYGAALIIELHEPPKSTDDKQFIKVLYLDSSADQTPNELKLPQCEMECPLTKFISLYQKYVSNDWEKECSKNQLKHHK